MNRDLKSWIAWRDAALGWVYPNWCQICDQERAVPSMGFVGDQCLDTVRTLKPPFCDRCGQPFDGSLTSVFECANCRDETLHFESARAAVIAGNCVREALHHYKYHRALWLEPLLFRWLVDAARPNLQGSGWTGLVPVPLHPVREREREFNQATRLARGLGVSLGIPVRDRWVIRAHHTPTQTRLNRSQRAENVRHAFVPGKVSSLAGECLIVVDDILTTGATTNAVAAVLRRLGASRVCVWTLARAIH